MELQGRIGDADRAGEVTRRLALGTGLNQQPEQLQPMLLRGRLDRFAAIDGERVAAGIAALVGAKGNGRRVHFNREIIALVAYIFREKSK